MFTGFSLVVVVVVVVVVCVCVCVSHLLFFSNSQVQIGLMWVFCSSVALFQYALVIGGRGILHFACRLFMFMLQ